MSLFEDEKEDLSGVFRKMVELSTSCNKLWEESAVERGLDPTCPPFVIPKSVDTKWVGEFQDQLVSLANRTYGNKNPLHEPLNEGQRFNGLLCTDTTWAFELIRGAAGNYTQARLNPDVKSGVLGTRRVTLAEFVYEYNNQDKFKVLGRSLFLYWLGRKPPEPLPVNPAVRRVYMYNKIRSQHVSEEVITNLAMALPDNSEQARLDLYTSIYHFILWYYDRVHEFTMDKIQPPNWAHVRTPDAFLSRYVQFHIEKNNWAFEKLPYPDLENADLKLFSNFLKWLKRSWGVVLQLDQVFSGENPEPNYKQTPEELLLKATDHQKWREEVLPKIYAAGYSVKKS